MSLATSAALFNDDTYKINNDKQKHSQTSHNKTQKRRNIKNVDTAKMSNLLQTLHNSADEEEEDNEMGDFNPPEAPESSGVERTTDVKESPVSKYLREGDNNQEQAGISEAVEYNDQTLNSNGYQDNYGSQASNDEYYKKYIPNYPNYPQPNAGSVNKPYYNAYPSNSPSSQSVDNSVLIDKLNYMIHILEEQQDERLGSVTEEVILYSFLGIFIIFLVDSFTRIGKYKR